MFVVETTVSPLLFQLGRYGLVRPSFIPPKGQRELRLVSRYLRKVNANPAAETNRLHKLVDDAGIKLGGLIDGLAPSELIKLSGCLKAPKESLLASLEGDQSARHRQEIREHVRQLERHLEKLEAYLCEAMAPYAFAWTLLQAIPGIGAIAHKLIRTIYFMFTRREAFRCLIPSVLLFH